MTRPPPANDILEQIRSCLDAATSQPGLVKASVYQTEGYLRGLQGLAWEKPADPPPASDDPAENFLHDIRTGAIALRGRLKKESKNAVKTFLRGINETFPEAGQKNFLSALSRLWVRWDGKQDAAMIGRRIGTLLKQEYEEGIAGELSPYILDDRLHLRNVRDYLRMRGWLQGTIEHLRRKPDWESRSKAGILAGNFSSIVLRALHNANPNYAAEAVAHLPHMISRLDRAISNLAAVEPEASHFLQKNRATILTRALHSGYLHYAEEAAAELPRALKGLNLKISRLETTSPEEARTLRSNLSTSIYRALANGKFDL